MKTTFHTVNPRRAIRFLVVLCLLVGLALALPADGQMSPEEHASHHPGQEAGALSAGGAGPVPAATPSSANGMGGGKGGRPGMAGPPEGVGGGPPEGAGGMMGGGKGGGMGGMMEKMGTPKPKDFYPMLMDLPELPLDKRIEVEQQAGERMRTGVALMNESLDQLLQAASAENYTAMQASSANLREGLARFESGLAAKRALAEGKAPRNVALTWFKREMNLAYPVRSDEPSSLLGVTPFHLFTMVLLVAFALAMVAMYFFKMRRAAALFGRIEADKKSPPPGSAPELAGGKAPDEKKSPSGDSPAAPADKAAAPAGKPAAAPDKPAAGDKPAAPDNKLADAAEKLAGAADKLATAADKLAAPADKPAAPANKLAAPSDKAAAPTAKPAAEASPKGNGPAPSASVQEHPAATKFECLAPAARAVFLVGTFNNWDAKATPMSKDAKGNWEVAVALPPGRHEFKFVVDGASCCEPGCEGRHQGCPKCVPNEAGTMNRFIEVTSI